MTIGGYFGLTTPGPYLNEQGESHNCTFTGQQNIKTARTESAVNSVKKKKKNTEKV